MPRVTIRQIADASGLCHQTVSRILSGKADLHSPATVKRVTEIADRLGYRPHAGARLMRSGTTGNVALILDVGKFRSGMPPGLLEGILAALEQRGLGLNVVRYTDEQLSDESYVPKILKEISSDGLIANLNFALPRRTAALVKKHRVPLAWLNVKRRSDAVYPDDHGAARELVERLVAGGCRSVAYACHGYEPGPMQHYSKDDRLAGYRDAVKAAGMPRREILLAGGLNDRDTARAYADMLDGHEAPDAFVCYGRVEVAHMAMRLPPALGTRIRDGVRLAMFGHDDEFAGMPVAGMALDTSREGHDVVQMLLEKMKAPQKALPSMTVPFTYREGMSAKATL